MVVEVQAPETMLHGLRLPPWRPHAWEDEAARAAAHAKLDVVLVPLAVEAAGRRSADAGVLEHALSELAAARQGGLPIVVILDHAGPAAALWASERPLGPTDVPEPRSGRRPRPLEDGEWSVLTRRYGAAARACAAHELPCALGVDDDGLLHAALSPRTARGWTDARRRDHLLALHGAASDGAGCAIDVALVAEELCPGGLDPTDGIAIARALAAQGARRIYASAGSAVLPALRQRRKGGTARGASHALASAAWLVGRVDAPVVAVVPGGEQGIETSARRLRLSGLVVEVSPKETGP